MTALNQANTGFFGRFITALFLTAVQVLVPPKQLLAEQLADTIDKCAAIAFTLLSAAAQKNAFSPPSSPADIGIISGLDELRREVHYAILTTEGTLEKGRPFAFEWRTVVVSNDGRSCTFTVRILFPFRKVTNPKGGVSLELGSQVTVTETWQRGLPLEEFGSS